MNPWNTLAPWGGMRIVSENSEADFARNTAMAKVDWALRDLTANLMRVTRGAGRPYEIGRQAQALVEALIEYRDAVGHFPSSFEIANAVTAERRRETIETMSDDSFAHYYAEQAVILGSLQIIASRLLGQRAQEAAGETQMYDGLNKLEDIRTRRRKEWTSATKTAAKHRAKRPGAKARLPRSANKKPKA